MRTAVIGAGPAGLASAYTLAQNGRESVVIEKDSVVGGISKTVVKGDFRFDLGGHRFFSKNPSLNSFMSDLLGDELIGVGRKSRIYFDRKYFDYPLQPKNAIFGFGFSKAAGILASYLFQRFKRAVRPPTVKTLEDWVVDKFGRKMFELYFKSYTEKVWGIPCSELDAEWVAQRIKGMSLTKAIKTALLREKTDAPTTLLTHFTYPKLGIGRISERMAEYHAAAGCRMFLNAACVELRVDKNRVRSLVCEKDGNRFTVEADDVISSMPVTHLVRALKPAAPRHVLEAADRLRFRDFIAVCLMLDMDRVTEDTWLYIHEPHIPFGRIHEPKNWSPFMSPEGKTSLVMEYFCFKTDPIWTMPDEQIARMTQEQLEHELGFVRARDVIDYCVVRVPRAYPMYEIGFRKNLNVVLEYLKHFENLQLVGRNGTFRYNNMDHSLEMGILAARRLLGQEGDVLSVNRSEEYLEELRS